MHLHLGAVIGLVLFGALIDVVKTTGSVCYLATGGCPHTNVTFWLRNKYNGEGWMLNSESIERVPLMEEAPLVILIHGYTGHRDFSPNMELLPAYLEHGGYNVISADWGNMAQEGCYIQAAFNVVVAGRCIGHFLREFYRLRGEGWKNRTHVVGFSLGAHVAGIAGHFVGGLPRITGLDPALPLFTTHTANLQDRLDASDAQFIDVYHSNAGWKGRVSPLGHVDFYINNGGSQPGCRQNTSCDHVRAVEVFGESINSQFGFFAEPCTVGVAAFLTGWSKDACVADNNTERIEVAAGEYVNLKTKGTYKIDTNDSPPYARGRRHFGFFKRWKRHVIT